MVCNTATVSGEIRSIIPGNKFGRMTLISKRTSGTPDRVPVVFPEIFMCMNLHDGNKIKVSGRFQSENKENHGGVKLFLFADKIEVCEEDDENSVSLEGFICTRPTYRCTPNGFEITNFILAVNHYKRSDYIPCIAWGKNAVRAGTMNVGTHLKIVGRIQSRDYLKKISEDNSEVKTAYEVSIGKMEVIGSEKSKDQVADAE